MVKITYHTVSLERQLSVPRVCSLCSFGWNREVTVKAAGTGDSNEAIFDDPQVKAAKRAANEFDRNIRAAVADEAPDAFCERCGGMSRGAVQKYFGGDIRRGLMSRYRRGIGCLVGLIFLLMLFVMPVVVHVVERAQSRGNAGFLTTLMGDVRNHPIMSLLSALFTLVIVGSLGLIVQSVWMYRRVRTAIQASPDQALHGLARGLYARNRNSFDSPSDWSLELIKFTQHSNVGRSISS